MAYRFSPASRFYPKRPIRSFRDLGIYQSTNRISVEIMKRIVPVIPEASALKEDLSACCMSIPHLIAEAHSRRFDDKPKSMTLLEEVLWLCNKAVVYLEQAREVHSEQVDRVLADELIKQYGYARQKIFNFYKAWKRFDSEATHRLPPDPSRSQA